MVCKNLELNRTWRCKLRRVPRKATPGAFVAEFLLNESDWSPHFLIGNNDVTAKYLKTLHGS